MDTLGALRNNQGSVLADSLRQFICPEYCRATSKYKRSIQTVPGVHIKITPIKQNEHDLHNLHGQVGYALKEAQSDYSSVWIIGDRWTPTDFERAQALYLAKGGDPCKKSHKDALMPTNLLQRVGTYARSMCDQSALPPIDVLVHKTLTSAPVHTHIIFSQTGPNNAIDMTKFGIMLKLNNIATLHDVTRQETNHLIFNTPLAALPAAQPAAADEDNDDDEARTPFKQPLKRPRAAIPSDSE